MFNVLTLFCNVDNSADLTVVTPSSSLHITIQLENF